MPKITAETRACNRKAIEYTVESWSPGGDPRAFLTFAKRESNFNHTAIGDDRGAVLERVKKAWRRNKPKLEAKGNPWTGDASLWMGSFGLLQLMAPNHVGRWDPVAHPFCLFHPVINVVAAGRLWNKSEKMGAKNLIDVRMIWGFGSLKYGKGTPQYAERERTTIARLEAMGYPRELAYQSMDAWGLRGFGLGVQGEGDFPDPAQDQGSMLWAISENLGLPPVPPPDARVPSDWGCKPDDADDPKKKIPADPGTDAWPAWLIALLALLGVGAVAIAASGSSTPTAAGAATYVAKRKIRSRLRKSRSQRKS